MLNIVRTIHFNEEIKRHMIKIVKASKLPVTVKGKSAGGPSVAITENGQFQLSKVSTDFLGGAKTCVIGFDGLKVYLFKPDAKTVAKVPVEDHVAVKYPKKGTACTISAVNILRTMTEYGASVTYDFKGSRNQTFTAVLDEKSGAITFDLPESGKLAPKPVTPRAKKEKPATSATVTPVVVKAAAAAPAVEEELSIDAA